MTRSTIIEDRGARYERCGRDGNRDQHRWRGLTKPWTHAESVVCRTGLTSDDEKGQGEHVALLQPDRITPGIFRLMALMERGYHGVDLSHLARQRMLQYPREFLSL